MNEHSYLQLLNRILVSGKERKDRTGVGTLGLFGYQMRFDLQEGFPILTTKKVHWKSVVAELLWFLSGDTNEKILSDQGVTIWKEWAKEDGSLGPIYGHQWRAFGQDDTHRIFGDCGEPGVDQIQKVVDEIVCNPTSRRLIVTAWDPRTVDAAALPPCHVLFQFYVHDGYLSCQLYQRSADVFLGVPFNIASYALLTHLVAHVTGLKVGELVHTMGDVHLYKNHVDAALLQLSRSIKEPPRLILNPVVTSIFDFKASDIILDGYEHHPSIKAPVAV